MTEIREKGWWYPWIFVGFMGFVVAVNMLLLFLAVSTFSGLDTERAFEKGIDYNKALAGAGAQAGLGWSVAFAFRPERDATRRGKIAVSAKDRDGQALYDLTVKAFLIRPTSQGSDMSVDLENLGNGDYAAAVSPPLPGRWIVRVHLWRGQDSFQMKQEIMVP
ncbi:MAG: hypothetical protein A3G18_06290 [Rhodospirillales bacterium RIFCSPLOWO2_12_FULL_58_28]|nr:MAG: hypothetical protein A3H92_04105 [Rhodospirillales bacterium RIFCSPLOWO2_02_FULL_58_16]OHC76792.1 MAG: hypothetical protein A3G18_06290 [Rhodospirillales bacterium RIFCSPLOWO2_12_FULL_58_28]